MPEVAQVFPFENRGKEIGVTLQHPHGQIYGYPLVTPRTATMLARAAEHRARTGRLLLRDVLDAERADGSRVVARGRALDGVRAVCRALAGRGAPGAAPRRARPARPWTTTSARSWRTSTSTCCSGWTATTSTPTAARCGCPTSPAGTRRPAREGRDLARLHLQLTSVLRAPGKLKYLAGSESGMGAWVNDTTPERIAARLRAVRRRA